MLAVLLAVAIFYEDDMNSDEPFYMNNYLNALFIQRVYYEGLGGGNSVRGMNENFVLSADWGMPIDRQNNNKYANFYVKMGYLF